MRNNDIYTEEMSKSIWDKAFFMDKIQTAKCVIDFGCADGAMIRTLAPLFPSIQFVGYDIDDNMIDRVEQAIEDDKLPNMAFFRGNELQEMVQSIKDYCGYLCTDGSAICLNFSSVLHEVFSFENTAAIEYIIKELNPKYITIRDMYFNDDNYMPFSYKFTQELLDAMEIDGELANQFQSKQGSILNNEGFLHFLMKYQWKDNGWEEELEENYFSWDIKVICGHLLHNDYSIIYENYYQLPYLTEKWMKYFYRPDWTTHAQFILVRF